MSGELGRASYELDADLRPLRRAMAEGRRDVNQMEDALDALTAVSAFTETALKRIKMNPNQAAETRATASAILAGVRGISDESREAARQIDLIRISETQATDSIVAGERIKRNINDIGDEADRTRRKLESVQIAGGVTGRSGVGVGPFGSGFGRVGLLGTAVAGGVLTAPAFGPALAGVLAATPVMAGAAVGALGTLALAFQGVGKAIDGDKKAFDKLTPSAQEFVLTIRSLHGWFKQLKEVAAGSLFPGLASGLKAALSPGTLSAVTTAVRDLGGALGSAGEMWGKYFGSALFRQSFGPLMQSAARTITTLSDAALGLFDALGVLSRAAIPLTDWITRGIDRGAQLANAWLRAKEATGELGGAMDEAQVSIRLLGNLLGSLINFIGSLGRALYPVSQIAVKDLTDGLNALAGMIDRNKETIRAIVTGALSALKEMIQAVVQAVTALRDSVKTLLGPLGNFVSVADAVKIALEGIVALKIANAFLTAATGVDALGTALIALRKNPATWAVLAALAAAAGIGKAVSDFVTGTPNVNQEAYVGARWKDKFYVTAAGTPLADVLQSAASGKNLTQAQLVDLSKGLMMAGFVKAYDSEAQAKKQYGKPFTTLTKQTNGSSAWNRRVYNQQQVRQLLEVAGAPPDVATNLARIAMAESGGRSDALNDNARTGDYSIGLFQENFLGKMGVARTAKYAPKFGLSGQMPVKQFVKWLGDHPAAQAQVALDIFNSQGYGAWTTAKGLGITGGGAASNPWATPPPFDKNVPASPTGESLLSQKMRDALANANNRVVTAGGPQIAARWLNVELDLLEKARGELDDQLKGSTGKKRAAIKDELRNIDHEIAQVNKDIASNLKEQAKAVKQSFSGKLATAKSNISSAAAVLKATLGEQFAAQTQSQIDGVLGPRYFQGTDANGMQLLTPLERQLADMQAADQLKQLQDAVSSAETPEERAAAQRQLDMYNLSIAAAAERAQADHDYAEAVKKYQAERAELEREMNLRLDNFADGLSDGTTQIGDLNAIVTEFGLSLSADDGVIQDFATLGDAVKALSLVLAQEASKLAGAGDKKGAKAAQDIIDRIGIKTGLGQFRGAIPMADGGIGSVSMPTLFLAGEAGYEEFAFSGAGGSLADRFSSGGDGGEYAEVRSFANELDLAIWIGKKLKAANKSGIKFAIA